MTIYNLYMNNTEPLTPYDLITVADHTSTEIVWRGAFLNYQKNINLNSYFHMKYALNIIIDMHTL